jgi:hypothetical protein
MGAKNNAEVVAVAFLRTTNALMKRHSEWVYLLSTFAPSCG